MLHLIPRNRYTELCVKAIESLIKVHDIQLIIRDFDSCDVANFDELLEEETAVVVISNLVPARFHDYLISSGVRFLDDTYYWQALPTDAWEVDRVIGALEPLIHQRVNIHFLLPTTISQAQWYKMFATDLQDPTISMIKQCGTQVAVLPTLELATIVYTLADKQKHRSLIAAATRLSPETRNTVMELMRVFIDPLDALLAKYRRLPRSR
jgi:hypothetical protein